MNTYVIGDLHGGYRGLIECLHKVNFNYENDKLISVGDLCDGWSETHLIIKELKKIRNFVHVMGNHDEWTLEGLAVHNKLGRIRHNSAWLSQGGQATKDSYDSLNDEEKLEFLEFLKAAKPYYIDEENRLFVHAGYNRSLSLSEEDYSPEWEIERGGNDLWWDRTMWDNLTRGFYPEDPRYREVFIGHTPTIRYSSSKPINIGNVWNVDTGAAFYGPVTIMNIDTHIYHQSDYVFRLYPNERGRNRLAFNDMIIEDWNKSLLSYDIHLID
jgi:serine/threonine protein phosphatase 1